MAQKAPQNRRSDIHLPYLQAWRADRGLTQRQLAEKSGAGRGTILRAEKGEAVNVLTATKLAKALGLSVQELREHDPATVRPTAK